MEQDNNSPLRDTDNPLYGSLGAGLFEQLPHDEGGLMNEMPTEGYCLTFIAETDEFIVKYDNGKLFIKRNDEIFSEENWAENRWEHKLDEITDGRRQDLLKGFKEANINYKIIKSRDKMQKYIFVIIKCKKNIAEEWADKHNIDVPIEPAQAVRVGRTFKEFWLAQRTRIDENDSATFYVKDNDNNNDNNNNNNNNIGNEYNKLSLSYWNDIHIAYETSIDPRVYKKDILNSDSIITHRLYLRILYEMLTDDQAMGGANFIVEKYLQNTIHPLIAFFALHQSRTERPDVTKEKCFKCRTPNENLKFCDDIRNYYGENVGFYFHFLVHYTKWLYPMAILGTIWFIIQILFEEISDVGLATPGSTLIVLIAIMWSTMMIENWYRREWKLRFKWGMMRYKQTEIPRPTFSGKIQVSKMNGEIIETYRNWWTYCLKIIFSMSTMLLCVAIVVVIVFSLFILRGSINDNDPNSDYMTIGIGMLNSIQIFIMNKIYTFLAYKLNEWEGHRLQQEYYNNLVIKRIIFIVFNSFYSLIQIAFLDPRYNDNLKTKRENDIIRLKAVQTQLITLFVMAIILQNSLEILFPWLANKIKIICAKREQQEWEQDDNNDNNDDALLSDKDQLQPQGVYGLFHYNFFFFFKL